jgi:hypothetical protein
MLGKELKERGAAVHLYRECVVAAWVEAKLRVYIQVARVKVVLRTHTQVSSRVDKLLKSKL